MDDVDSLISKLDPKIRALTQGLQVLIKKALPDADEKVKWGYPFYAVNGRSVAALVTYKDHVNLAFTKGALLNSKLLEGTGKGIRHIKVRTMTDIKEEELTRLLKEAAKLA
ncbi:MAG: DUF1801 domain-containing protein [Thaumarchaeota archaeon]|nr:DUF1801 domain-containing protein [Nitrososphaerota archaeon]